MWTIRQEHIEAFDQSVALQFENELVAHLKSFSACLCESIGDVRVRQVVRLGFRACKSYGFAMRGPVRFFIELMFMFGSYFDTDIQHIWASEILHKTEVPEMFRADALHQRMLDCLLCVAGPGNRYAKSALEKMHYQIANAGFDEPIHLVPVMESIYPEKCAWMGPDRLLAVLEGGVHSAEAYGITLPRGVGLFSSLAFFLGHGFADDPLYAWIANILNDLTFLDPDVRVKKLERETLSFFEKMLATS